MSSLACEFCHGVYRGKWADDIAQEIIMKFA